MVALVLAVPFAQSPNSAAEREGWIANSLYALLGAILGLVLSSAPSVYRRVIKYLGKRKAQRRKDIMVSGAVDKWLINYYDQHGANVFYSRIDGFGKHIPVIFNDAWLFSKTVEPKREWLVTVAPERPAPYPINEHLLDSRRQMGAMLFRSWRKSLFLDSLVYEPPAIVARPCEYFEIATTLISIEEETYRNVLRQQRRFFRRPPRTPVRDAHLYDFPRSGERRLRPSSVGCHTVIILGSGNNRELIIQTRGETVITYPNVKAAIPNFGFEPHFFGDRPSAYGCIFYNFMREYLEELFDYEEIIGRTSWSHNPDWFFELPEARSLMAASATGGFVLTYLGSAMECLSSTMTIALLAEIRDGRVIEELKRHLTPNYEVALPTTSRTPIDFVRIDDARLAIWHEQGRFQPTSSFAVSLALRHLNATAT